VTFDRYNVDVPEFKRQLHV